MKLRFGQGHERIPEVENNSISFAGEFSEDPTDLLVHFIGGPNRTGKEQAIQARQIQTFVGQFCRKQNSKLALTHLSESGVPHLLRGS
jgi:hypothetical protein